MEKLVFDINLLHLYKSCLFAVYDKVSLNFSKTVYINEMIFGDETK